MQSQKSWSPGLGRVIRLVKCFLLGQVIVPPSWIVKVPRKGSFKSSLKTSPNKKKKKGIGKTEKIDEAECEDDAGVVQVRVKRDDPCFRLSFNRPFFQCRDPQMGSIMPSFPAYKFYLCP